MGTSFSRAQRRPAALTLSRSPTSTVGVSPAAQATSRPLSTAITAAYDVSLTTRSDPPPMTIAIAPTSLPPLALPRSGSRVGDRRSPSQPADPASSPVLSPRRLSPVRDLDRLG